MDEEEQKEIKEPTCARCGLRSYGDTCINCGTPIIHKNEEDEEEYDWREKKR